MEKNTPAGRHGQPAGNARCIPPAMRQICMQRLMEVAVQGERKAMLVRISGRVQGVSFRIWTLEEAERLGLSGWVRNEADGSVKALIAGPETAVSTMLARFWQGPRGASVSGVVSESADPYQASDGFRITG
jgi:acylphosphatase